jgi:hypothetical protein
MFITLMGWEYCCLLFHSIFYCLLFVLHLFDYETHLWMSLWMSHH